MRLKFHTRRKAKLKDLGKYRAIARNRPTSDFYEYLNAKERAKYEKSALFVWERTSNAVPLAGGTDITGWEAAGFDKTDLGWYSATRSERERKRRPYPDPGLVVLEDTHREVVPFYWTDKAGKQWWLQFVDGKLEHKDVEGSPEQAAWNAGVRGPNDIEEEFVRLLNERNELFGQQIELMKERLKLIDEYIRPLDSGTD